MKGYDMLPPHNPLLDGSTFTGTGAQGWTKREIYALHAMQGYCVNQEFSNNMADILEAMGLARGSKENASGVRKAIAQAAFGVADAMLVASKS